MSKFSRGLLFVCGALVATCGAAMAQDSTPRRQRPVTIAASSAQAQQQAGAKTTEDPNTTRLFFGPTARSLPKGQTYLGVYELSMPFLQVGITNRFSIGGGTPLVFGIENSERPFWITPKLQVLNTGRTQVALGVFHAFTADYGGGGIAYGVVTTGDRDRSFTAGAGMAYAVEGGRAGVVMVGGDARIRRNVKLITENYVWRSGDGVLTGGFRFFGEHLSADLGMAIPIGAGEFVAFPVGNFVYSF